MRRVLFLLGLLGVAGLAGALYVLSNIPLPPARVQAQTSFIVAGDGSPLAELHAEEDRVDVTLDVIPPVLVDAVLSAEDRDFFGHGGIDPVGIARALWADLRNEGVRQGGSTITQQYVKNVYLTSERTITRKIREAVLAIKIERELSKQEILERYLNTVYFGRGAYGVEAASHAYFDKSVQDIGLPEAAYLAGLIRAPETADASLHPDVAAFRRRSVLDSMLENGYITAEQHDQVDALPFESYVTQRPEENRDTVVEPVGMGAEYFVDYVRRYLLDRYGAAVVYGGGLRVETTFDPRLQRAAYDSVCGFLNQPGDPAGALVAVDDRGHVPAMVGGCNWEQSQVNLAVGLEGGGTGRQPGSVFKAFVLAQAVREGYSVESSFSAPPEVVIEGADAGEPWEVANYDDADQGKLNLIEATTSSSNTVYAQLITTIPDGPAKVVALAQRMGVRSPIEPVPSITLGTQEVSPLDMASAFSTLASRGVHIEPVVVLRVIDAEGRVLEDNTVPEGTRVLDEGQADIVNEVLQRVVESGTGTAADFGVPAAGKTGTTEDYGDAWFVGYTPTLTAAVWMGYPEGNERKMQDVRGIEVTGGSFPAEIWRAFMVSAAEGRDMGTFPRVTSFPGQILNERLPDLGTTTTTTGDDTETSAPPDTQVASG